MDAISPRRAACATAATFLLALAAAVPHAAAHDRTHAAKQAHANAAPAGATAPKYCVKGGVDEDRLSRMTCKTRAEWIRGYNLDPVELAAREP